MGSWGAWQPAVRNNMELMTKIENLIKQEIENFQPGQFKNYIEIGGLDVLGVEYHEPRLKLTLRVPIELEGEIAARVFNEWKEVEKHQHES